MRLTEKYRPTTLDEVFGQPPVTLLKALVRDPYECCIMLDGPPGCGKTALAVGLPATMRSNLARRMSSRPLLRAMTTIESS